MICDTTFTGDPIHPEVKAAVHQAGRLLEAWGTMWSRGGRRRMCR
jgi:amidase